MASLKKTKLVRTGDEGLDYYITLGFIIFIGFLIWNIGSIFWSAYSDATRSIGRRGRVPLLRKRQIFLFLALAVVALFIVNGVKFQYLKFKVASWEEIRLLLNQVKDTSDFRRSSWISSNRQSPGEVSSSMSGLFHQPDEYLDRMRRQLSGAIAKLHTYFTTDKAFKVPKDFRMHVRGVYEGLWTARKSDSIWHNFTLLVSTHRRFWWTQQWFMGYMSWAVFMAVECHHRDIQSSAVFSFAMLGYIFGLSGVQCLFYILLLMKPKIPRRCSWMPWPVFTLASFGAETIGVVLLNFAVHNWYERDNGRLFNYLQAAVMGLPALSQICVTQWPRVFMRQRGSASKAKRSLAFVYFVTSVIMAASIHLYITMQACADAELGNSVRWPLGMRWMRPETRSMRKLTGTVRALINALGDHDWVSAVGADVLLSAVALCCWAVVGNVDPRSMIKCGIFPWLDETQDAVGVAARRLSDAAEDAYDVSADRIRDGLATARARARQGSQELRYRASHWGHERGLDESEGEDEDVEWQQSQRQPTMRSRKQKPRSTARETTRSRSRSRSRASVSPVKKTASRRSSRTRDRSRPLQSSESEEDYDERRILIPTSIQTLTAPAEAAGVAWAIFALGGLGMASTAVYGAGEVE